MVVGVLVSIYVLIQHFLLVFNMLGGYVASEVTSGSVAEYISTNCLRAGNNLALLTKFQRKTFPLAF